MEEKKIPVRGSYSDHSSDALLVEERVSVSACQLAPLASVTAEGALCVFRQVAFDSRPTWRLGRRENATSRFSSHLAFVLCDEWLGRHPQGTLSAATSFSPLLFFQLAVT